MTNKVLKSSLRGMDFEQSVSAFADELTRWLQHMKKVGVDPEYQAHPRPGASKMIEDSVRVEDDAALPDYEIIDDSPSPESVLRARKDELIVAVSKAEKERLDKILPPGKRRLVSITLGDIRSRDAERKNTLTTPLSTEEVEEFVVRTRPAEDAKFLSEDAERQCAMNAVVRHAAKLHHDIEDLTDETVQDWKPEPFPA